METLVASLTARRFRYTPLLELLHGRVTGRLDWRRAIATADLPADVAASIARIVRRTRLSWREKLAVAIELADHFRQGIAAGRSSTSLIESFGDERTAARLIRRGKLRARPLWRRTVRRAAQAFGIVMVIAVVGWAGLAARFFSGSPSPSVDYTARAEAIAAATPAADRAWPIYRQVRLNLGGRDQSDPHGRPEPLTFEIDGKKWPEIAEFVRRHKADAALARTAAGKPSVGFVNSVDGLDPVLYLPVTNGASGHQWYDDFPEPIREYERRDSLEMADIRTIGLLLCADARLAEIDGDGDRFFADIQALLGLSRQVRHDNQALFGQAVATYTWDFAVDQMDHAMANHPAVVSDDRIKLLAHELSVPRVPADLRTASSDRDRVHNLIQCMYTDDGHGDGRLTPQGWKLEQLEPDYRLPPWMSTIAGPLVYGSGASRARTAAEFDRAVAAQDAEMTRPLREADFTVLSYDEARTSVYERARYPFVSKMIPNGVWIAESSERSLGRRDGVLVAMALEIYHRRHGTYPAALAELTPDLLPAVPADRITGDPVKYRLIDGEPVIYSVGADRKDDGGRPVKARHDWSAENQAADWHAAPENAPSGDWILFPRVRTTE